MDPIKLKIKEILPQAGGSQKVATPNEQKDLINSITQEGKGSQEKSRILGAEAAEYAERVKVGNPLNRARLELVQEAAEDIGAFGDGDLTAVQAAYLARKFNLSGNETGRKFIAQALIEARREIRDGKTVDAALYVLYETMKRELESMGGRMESGRKKKRPERSGLLS